MKIRFTSKCPFNKKDLVFNTPVHMDKIQNANELRGYLK